MMEEEKENSSGLLELQNITECVSLACIERNFRILQQHSKEVMMRTLQKLKDAAICSKKRRVITTK
jgi:hypothetical protein